MVVQGTNKGKASRFGGGEWLSEEVFRVSSHRYVHLHHVPTSPPSLNHHRYLRLALSRIVWHQISFKPLKTQYPRGHHVAPPHPWAET